MSKTNRIARFLDATARLAGCSAGVGSGAASQGPIRDAHFWGENTAVLRACAAIGLSRDAATTAEAPMGTVTQWQMRDLDGSVRGRVVFIAGPGKTRSSATIWDVVEHTPACFAADVS